MSLLLLQVALPICIAVVIAFGLWALYLSSIQAKLRRLDVDFFLTARNSQSVSSIAWSFFSASVGAWVLFVPSAFCVDSHIGAGWLGLITYPIFTGLPIIVIAWTGNLIRNQFPTVLSIGDYVKLRFGTCFEFYITLLVLINTGIALSAEYTAIGDLFLNVLGASRLIPVLLVGIVTMIYTATGGLYVSILTDKYQAILSMILIVITAIYVVVNFRFETLPELPEHLGLNYYGYSSIATIGVPLIAAACFTDCYWQRVWSSRDERALKLGAFHAAIMTVFVVFFFAMMGFLATWAGVATEATTSFFDILKLGQEEAPIWIIVIVSVVAMTMNESAIDSFQNAITSTVMSLAISMGFSISLWHVRIVSILLNFPLILVGLQGYKLTSLYLIMNVLTTTATLPIAIGLFPAFDHLVNGSSVLFGCAFSLTTVIVYGYIRTGNLLIGIYTYFFVEYAWETFVLALVSSGLGVVLWVLIEQSLYAILGFHQVKQQQPQEHLMDVPTKENLPVPSKALTF